MLWAKPGLALLLLGLWVLLPSGQCSPGQPVWRYLSSEVVIPKKEMQHGKSVRLPGWLSYSLRFGGRRHVIHMHAKSFMLSQHLLMTTQDDQGALQIDYPQIPMDCYYVGYLEDIPLSRITVNTCYGGLEGIMKLDDLAYEIKPLQDSHTFEHIVSQIVADHDSVGPTYKLGHKEDFDPLFPDVSGSVDFRMSSFNYILHMASLKGHVQVSNEQYQLFSNITQCAVFVKNMFSLVDSFLTTAGFQYYLAVLTVYNVADPANMNTYNVPGCPLHTYYVQNFYDAYQPASTTVLKRNAPHEASFTIQQYTICGNRNMIFTASQGRHYLLWAIVNANLLARMVGFTYDLPACRCQRRATCLMQQFPELTDSFSNCSIAHVQHIVKNFYINTCYYLVEREYFNRSLLQQRCGNYVIEDGEQCDCGSFKQCYSNKCCANNCAYTPGSICDQHSCCTNCTYTPVSTLCRPVQNSCDLPEYCTGSTYLCPNDAYLQDGTPCSEEGFCYHGNCSDPNVHCKEIFGEDAENGPEECYIINNRTFRFGHCSRIPLKNRYIGCSLENSKCGRLQCVNVSRIPILQDHQSFHQSLLSGVTCFGLDEHRAMGTRDNGRVRDGALCARGLFCRNLACNQSVGNLRYDCFPEKCSHRGVCNNNRHCHCHVGWDPPLCLSPGAGGSQDSGPPPRRRRPVRTDMGPVIFWRVVMGRLFAFILALLCGVATNVRTMKTTIVKEKSIPEP